MDNKSGIHSKTTYFTRYCHLLYAMKPLAVMEYSQYHYYPFGLTMRGISNEASTIAPTNKRKFNDGTEFSNEEFLDRSGLEVYETPFRSYDPQIGRFHQID